MLGRAAGLPTGRSRSRPVARSAYLATVAMINVDFASPSLVLGAALIGCGVALLQVRPRRTMRLHHHSPP